MELFGLVCFRRYRFLTCAKVKDDGGRLMCASRTLLAVGKSGLAACFYMSLYLYVSPVCARGDKGDPQRWVEPASTGISSLHRADTGDQ